MACFLVFGFRLRQGYGGQVVSAQLQGFQPCSFAEASPKTKNPRCTPLHLVCQCSTPLASKNAFWPSPEVAMAEVTEKCDF
jgi:hypothetical protein